MTKNTYIENYMAYQKSTDKSPATIASYRSDLMQFAIWFEYVNKVEMSLNDPEYLLEDVINFKAA